MRRVALGPLAAALCLLRPAALPAQVLPAPRAVERGDGASAPGFELASAHGAFFPLLLAFADADLTGERYRVEVGAERVVATAGSTVGAAWAAATLLQQLRVERGGWSWPRTTVQDEPDLAYRSFMVDMGRNPHSPATLRAVVDMCWLAKVRYLHLHLTDDQLFSWPSQAFPRLCSERAGWTRDDFVALEKYAVARGVALVPELDVPGHSGILRREYPEVFGATPTELATSAKATEGVQTLIAEMLDVFGSSPYMHVGGDEAYGVPHAAQRAFLNRLHLFVRAKGRRMIVWEGPPPGDGEDRVHADVLHCCWRAVEFPAQRMQELGHEVIAAPWDPMYVVDHYPRTMFTAVDLERCYQWDRRVFRDVDPGMPTFAEPHRAADVDGIVGFCMPWWEGREENLFALCLPRLLAVSCAAWNRDGERDFADFLARLDEVTRRFERIAGVALPELPFADPNTQRDNVAYRAEVTASRGAHQPHFGPARLTNGVTDRFDHFLGFSTKPEPLELVLTLRRPAVVSRVVVYECAVGPSHEAYELFVTSDGATWQRVGGSEEGTRGDLDHVTHRFDAREVHALKVVTRGCEGLTFPSFSRLSEVMAFRE